MDDMQAAFITSYGSNQKLQIGKFPIPEVTDNNVLIQIHAASLNPIDFKIRDGKLKVIKKYKFPLILGHDLAGVVVKLGKNVKKFSIGDAVYSRPSNGSTGCLAEYISVDQSDVAPMPKNLSFVEAASLPLVALTSWQALIDVANIQPGDHVFIQAGSGGVGSFAIQLAKTKNCHVITTTSATNVELVKSLGADEVLDYKKSKFDEVLNNIKVVFDTLGGEALYKSFKTVCPGGWVVSIAGDPDANTARDMNLGFLLTLIFRYVGKKVNRLSRFYHINYRFILMKANGDQLNEITKLVENNKIKPVVDKVFSFADSQKALEYLEKGHARGKVVVKICS